MPMKDDPRRELANLLGKKAPDFGAAICDVCGGEFIVGEFVARQLETDPYQTIRCRACHAKHVQTETE